MFGSLHQAATRQLKELEPRIRLVVIHPNYLQQHFILPELLKEGRSIYVSFQNLHLTHLQMRERFYGMLEMQMGHRQLGDVEHVIFDECDRAKPEELGNFLQEVLDTLPKGRIFIFSRVIPHAIINLSGLKKKSQFIPADESLMLWDYAQLDENEPTLLEVRALGRGHVLLNGVSVDHWDGMLPRALFFYFIDRGMVTRSEIFETFWPDLPVKEATNVFHVTKRKISEVLGIDLTMYWSGFYHISSRIRLSYDVALFSELVQDSAVVSVQDAVSVLQKAQFLYRGNFLTSVEMKWAVDRRSELVQVYCDTMVGLAKGFQGVDLRQELGCYLQASAANPVREDFVYNIMLLYREQGMLPDALKAYGHLEQQLQETLKVAPSPHLQELAAEIRTQLGQSNHQT